jgi:hypothetical protein
MAVDITVYRGNTDTRTVTITSGGVAFDLTNYVLKFVVKADYGKADTDAILSVVITVSAPLTGVGVLALTHANTDISPGTYVCEIKLYKADGTYIRTLDVGSLIVKNVVLLEIPVVP